MEGQQDSHRGDGAEIRQLLPDHQDCEACVSDLRLRGGSDPDPG